MKPYEDSPEDSERGIRDALEGRPAPGGFVVCALDGEEIVGLLTMLRTGMQGYIPPNLLLFLAVRPDSRRNGVGTGLVRRALEAVDGAVKLHVEPDNPAKALYESVGFTPTYVDMRLVQEADTHE